MPDKLKLALYWAASCGGCEMAVLELYEKILTVAEHADILFWPVGIDAKYKDVEAMPDKHIDLCLYNGAIRNSESEHIAKLLRQKSKVMVAYGSCACEGCIPALANMTDKDGVFKCVYDRPIDDFTLTFISIKRKKTAGPYFGKQNQITWRGAVDHAECIFNIFFFRPIPHGKLQTRHSHKWSVHYSIVLLIVFASRILYMFISF